MVEIATLSLLWFAGDEGGSVGTDGVVGGSEGVVRVADYVVVEGVEAVEEVVEGVVYGEILFDAADGLVEVGQAMQAVKSLEIIQE